jgi:hypothetical protein
MNCHTAKAHVPENNFGTADFDPPRHQFSRERQDYFGFSKFDFKADDRGFNGPSINNLM